MKILYVGDLNFGGSCLMRLEVLRELAHEVAGFDTIPYTWRPGKVRGYFFRHFPPVGRLNADLLKAFEAVKPDLVWVDKGRYIYPETLATMKKAGAKLVHYSSDTAFKVHDSKHFDQSVPLYDVLVTIKDYELGEYRKKGARKLLFQNPAYDRAMHLKIELSSEEKKTFENDVVFIGRYEAPRVEALEALWREGIQLAIWGPYFEGRAAGAFLKACWRGRGVIGLDYSKALSGAKIGLCFLSKNYPDRITSRTFEIPAIGGFMLTERTDEQKAVFNEGVEAEYFGDVPELVSKVKQYLADGEARIRIARQGHLKCVEGGNSYHDRLQEILKVLADSEG
jgi:spore maturation protein CgeB